VSLHADHEHPDSSPRYRRPANAVDPADVAARALASHDEHHEVSEPSETNVGTEVDEAVEAAPEAVEAALEAVEAGETVEETVEEAVEAASEATEEDSADEGESTVSEPTD